MGLPTTASLAELSCLPRMKFPRISLAALIGAQAQITFNDCAAKFMLIALAQQLARQAGTDPKSLIALIAALLISPYIFWARSAAGWLIVSLSALSLMPHLCCKSSPWV